MHCDVLYKLYESRGKLSFRDAKELDTNYLKLVAGGVKVQAFAIFLEPTMKTEQKFQAALDQIHYFYTNVLHKHPNIKLIRNWSDIQLLGEEEIGALLTLEGVDAIGNDLQKLSILYELGVRSVGLTWNHANLAADGAGEPRGAGLTAFGKEIVEWNNDHHIFTDVSHLSEKAFWDVIAVARYPIASHSNARAICDHVRNLDDEQAKALFAKDGLVHIVYYPPFVNAGGAASVEDVVRHIDHLCALGGEKQIGLGSDFDGMETKITGLEDASMHPHLLNTLLKYYREEQVKGFAFTNFITHLPEDS